MGTNAGTLTWSEDNWNTTSHLSGSVFVSRFQGAAKLSVHFSFDMFEYSWAFFPLNTDTYVSGERQSYTRAVRERLAVKSSCGSQYTLYCRKQLAYEWLWYSAPASCKVWDKHIDSGPFYWLLTVCLHTLSEKNGLGVQELDHGSHSPFRGYRQIKIKVNLLFEVWVEGEKRFSWLLVETRGRPQLLLKSSHNTGQTGRLRLN